MTGKINNTIPDPKAYEDWKAWARDLFAIVSNTRAKAQQPVEPQVVLLAHRLQEAGSNLGDEKATTDGMMMYDAAQDCPIYSYDGQWWPLTPAVTPDAIFVGGLPTNSVIDGGAASTTLGSATVDFNVTFSSPPLVFLTIREASNVDDAFTVALTGVTTTGFVAVGKKVASTFDETVTEGNFDFNWIAIGTLA